MAPSCLFIVFPHRHVYAPMHQLFIMLLITTEGLMFKQMGYEHSTPIIAMPIPLSWYAEYAQEFGYSMCTIQIVIRATCYTGVAPCAPSNPPSNIVRHKRRLVLCKCLVRSVSCYPTSGQSYTHHHIFSMSPHIHMQSTSAKDPLVLSAPLHLSQRHRSIHPAHPNKAATDLRMSSKRFPCVTVCSPKRYSLPTVLFYQSLDHR